MRYDIKGHEAKTIEIQLSPGEEFYAERGALVYQEAGIQADLRWVGKGITQIFSGMLSGESPWIIRYENRDVRPHVLALAGRELGLFIHNMEKGESLILRRGTYVASARKVRLRLSVGLRKMYSGMGLLFQKVEGEGTLILNTFGEPIQLHLEPEESLYIDEDHLIALKGIDESRITPHIRIGNLFQGEGFSRMRVTGPGTIYLSPVPWFSRFRQRGGTR